MWPISPETVFLIFCNINGVVSCIYESTIYCMCVSLFAWVFQLIGCYIDEAFRTNKYSVRESQLATKGVRFNNATVFLSTMAMLGGKIWEAMITKMITTDSAIKHQWDANKHVRTPNDDCIALSRAAGFPSRLGMLGGVIALVLSPTFQFEFCKAPSNCFLETWPSWVQPSASQQLGMWTAVALEPQPFASCTEPPAQDYFVWSFACLMGERIDRIIQRITDEQSLFPVWPRERSDIRKGSSSSSITCARKYLACTDMNSYWHCIMKNSKSDTPTIWMRSYPGTPASK